MKRPAKGLVRLLVLLFLMNSAGFAADKGDFSVTPKMKNGAKWRLGYYQGGDYPDYYASLLATARALMDLGWLEKAEIPVLEPKKTGDLWNWLATEAKSNYLEFAKDGYYSSAWDEVLRTKLASEIIKRLREHKDLDLMIAAGTWAGKDLANNDHHTNTLVISTSEPVSSGIIKSIDDSGHDHLHARVDPARFQRQVRIFHDIVGFKRLGVAYANSDSGRSYAALDRIKEVADERGFEILSCHTKDDIPDSRLAGETVVQCFRELCQKVDAIYVTKQNGVNKKSIPELAKTAISCGLPTFSQTGSEEVQWGFLLSISLANFKYVGRFHAETIGKVLNGAPPRQLDQVFEGPPQIAINLRTASLIGFDPPVDTLGAADEIYQEITSP